MKPSKRTLYEYLEEYAGERGEERFLFDEETAYSAEEALRISRGLAAQMADKGVKSGLKVGVKATRTVKTILAFYALQFLGAVAVMHDPREPLSERIRVEDGKIIADGRAEELSFAPRGSFGREFAGDSESGSITIFTSGSTGESKSVVLSQYNFINNSLDTSEIGGYREDDVNILIVPLHHVFGLALIVTAAVTKHAVFVPRAVDTEYIADCMIKYGATRLNGVPSLYLSLANSPRAKEIKSLRCGLIGGAPCGAEQFSRIEKNLKITLVPVYGMSECVAISCGDYRDPPEKRRDNVGKVYSMNEVRILSDGEICVRSPAQALCYGDGERVADADGWLHTGDLGHFDEEGYLHVDGRKKDIIIRNGNNLSPTKIENALISLGGVEGAAVVGVKDEFVGEVPCAMVVLKAGESRTAEEIRSELKTRLTKIELPVQIEFAERLPLTSTGKPDKEKIKKFFAGAGERRY